MLLSDSESPSPPLAGTKLHDSSRGVNFVGELDAAVIAVRAVRKLRTRLMADGVPDRTQNSVSTRTLRRTQVGTKSGAAWHRHSDRAHMSFDSSPNLLSPMCTLRRLAASPAAIAELSDSAIAKVA
jgi:hypothetical protein